MKWTCANVDRKGSEIFHPFDCLFKFGGQTRPVTGDGHVHNTNLFDYDKVKIFYYDVGDICAGYHHLSQLKILRYGRDPSRPARNTHPVKVANVF